MIATRTKKDAESTSKDPAGVNKPMLVGFHGVCIFNVSQTNSVAFTFLGAVLLLLYRSGCESEDFEQFVDEAYLVLDTWLAGKITPSPDHLHHFESFDCGGGCLHRLKAARRANDLLAGTVIRFDDVVQVLVGAMLYRV